MAKPIITIIGLGLTGTSVGLALQRDVGNFEIVGHDKDANASGQARRLNAVHRTEWNLHSACDNADMIVLAVPLNELGELFTHIREDLKPETLVFALVNVMQPAIQLAADKLPKQTHFVVGHPILSGIGGPLTPRADLFQEITFCLAPGFDVQPQAVQLASDLVERIGAKPLFVDALEHDGITAGVEQLPQVLAAALMRLSATSVSWREARRLAGRQFAQSTELGHSAAQLYSAWQSNRQNLLIRLQQLQQELTEWQNLLAAEGSNEGKDPLLTVLEGVEHERLTWEGQAILKRWEDAPKPAESVEARGMFQQMLFGNLMGRRDRKKIDK